MNHLNIFTSNLTRMKLLLATYLLLALPLWAQQSLTIDVVENHFKIDETHSLIVSHIENIESYDDLSSYSEVTISFNKDEYTFKSVPNILEYTNSYIISKLSNEYTLYFTQLPIISVKSQNTIVDEPKLLADFTYSDDQQVLTSNIGIELRGGSSQSYPKKTYDLEFWKDETGDDTYDVQFGDMRSDDDWILDALYNEPLRLRSYIANKLWLDMHSPHYLSDEPDAKSGADVMYVELFLNDDYNGIYNLSEQIDKKQLELKSYKDGAIRGELYKGVSWGDGAVTFTSLPVYDNNSRKWDGYELKYPKEDEITDWQKVHRFTDFIINSSDEDFIDDIWSNFNYDNYLDYFIFLNLLRATDNTGKNIYLAKYNDDEPYYYAPWDLDACFGTMWTGANEDITNDILTNGFHDRVIELNPDNYSTTIAERWVDYRENILETNNLIKIFEDRYQFLSENKIYEREALVYSNYQFSQQDLSYLLNWLHDRLNSLDAYFSNRPVAPTGLTATEVSETQIDLTWTAPPNDGGSAIIGYTLQYNKTGEIAFGESVTGIEADATSYSHTGLTAGTEYHYRVAAINSIGTGAYASTSATPGSGGGVSTFSVSEVQDALRLHPNPAGDEVRVALPVEGTYAVSLHTLAGKVVLHTQLQGGGTRTLSLSELQEGVYIVNVRRQDGQSSTHRLIKAAH